MKTLLGILFALVITASLVACDAPRNDASAKTLKPCEKSVDYFVYGRSDEVLYHQTTLAELSFGNGQTKPNDSFLYYQMRPDSSFEDAKGRLEGLVEQANRNLARLFAGPPVTGNGFAFRQERGYAQMKEAVYDRSMACQPATYAVWFGNHLNYFTGDSGHRYRTYISFVGETAYVTSTRHESGSKVTYSFPAQWFDRAVSGPFEDVSAFILPSAPELHHETEVGAELAEETLLAAIAGDLEEVAFFSFASDDYEGRKELRPVIVKAMELEYARSGATEYLFTGRTVSNTRVFAKATFEGGDFQLSGWQALSFGELEGNGGGGSAEASFSMTTTSVLEGSIYILPTNQ